MLTSELRTKMHGASVAHKRTHLVIEQARAANVAFELAETRTATMQARSRSRRHGSLRSPRVWTGTAAEECDSIESLCLRMPKDKAQTLKTLQGDLRQIREDVATSKERTLRMSQLQLEAYERVADMEKEVEMGKARTAELQSALNAQTSKVETMSVELDALQLKDEEYAPMITEALAKQRVMSAQLAQVLEAWKKAIIDALGDGESQPCEAGAADNNNPSPPHLPAVLQG